MPKKYPVQGNSKTGRAAELVRKLEYDFAYDPLEELVALSRKTDEPTKRDYFKAKIATEVLGYRYPKLKALEMKSNMGEVISVNVTFPESIKEELKEVDGD